MPPKISVCIPVYKNDDYILETVDSILNQTFQDFEIILLDDGSPDKNKTWNAISSINNNKIKAFKQTNTGIAGAKNACVAKSQGELIAFCDHDDLWKPNKLQKQVEIFDSNKEIGFCFSSFTRFNKKEGELKTLPKKSVDDDIFLWAVKKSYMFTSTIMLRKSLWDELKGYDTSYTLVDDYDFHLRMAYFTKGFFIEQSLVLYRLHEFNTSRSSESYIKYPKEKERIFRYWLSKKNISSARKKAVRKRLGKVYFDMSNRFYNKKKDTKNHKKYLYKAWCLDKTNFRYLSRLIRSI
ncbi:MAG TPA: glycosyltransferase family A protein [Victivallales bacterium]|nr:glycosyltransferase family A protein [Victivallales bacterium]